MSSYIYSPNNPYTDYLQKKQFVQDISYELSSDTRKLIASNEQIADGLLGGVHDLTEAAESGFEELGIQIGYLTDVVAEGFTTLNKTFRWGFSGILLSLGHLNDNINELKSLLENSSKVWSYEQYFDARKAFLNGWHRESYDLVQHAINGYGSNTGYKLEHRFHFLLGQNLLGNDKNADASIIDPAKAEEAFLNAARYSADHFPSDAALSYLCASRSAYVRGSARRALEYADRALALDHYLLEAHFQRAKLFCHLGVWQDAESDLKNLFHKDPVWALKAADDGDMRKYERELNSAITSVTRTINEHVDRLKPPLVQLLDEFDWDVRKLRVLRISGNESIKDMVAAAERERTSDTLSGAHKADELFTAAKKEYRERVVKKVDSALDVQVKDLKGRAHKMRSDIQARVQDRQKNREKFRKALPEKYSERFFNLFLVVSLIIGAIIFIYAIIAQRSSAWNLISLFFGMLLLAGFGGIFGRITGGIFGWFRKLLTPKKDMGTRAALRDLKKHDASTHHEEQLVEQDASVLRHLRSQARSL